MLVEAINGDLERKEIIQGERASSSWNRWEVENQ
jgi:hypothetical protein